MRFLAAWLAISSGIGGLIIFSKIITDGSIRVYEPNLAILYFETGFAAALILLGLWLVLKGLFNGTWTP